MQASVVIVDRHPTFGGRCEEVRHGSRAELVAYGQRMTAEHAGFDVLVYVVTAEREYLYQHDSRG